MMLERDKPWSEERLPMIDDRIRGRLGNCRRGSAMPTGSTATSAPAT